LQKLTDNQALAFKKIGELNARDGADGTPASAGLEVVTESNGLDAVRPSKLKWVTCTWMQKK
jgi:hypothetical protein